MTRVEVVALSLGAGYQSTALALLLDEGRLPGYPKPDLAVFADTQAEPPWVYATLAALEPKLSYPVLRTTGSNLAKDTWAGIRGEPSWQHPHGLKAQPGKPARGYIDIPAYGENALLKRQCTQNYKIEVIKRAIRSRFGWPITLTQYLGISSDEAVRIKSAREAYITNSYPLAMSGWSRSDCAKYLADSHADIPVGRSACYFCPFHSPREWLEVADHAPELFEDACRMDEALESMPSGPFHLVKHGTLRGAVETMRMQGKFDLDPVPGDECTGHCMV